jgi:hypothetical protein
VAERSTPNDPAGAVTLVEHYRAPYRIGAWQIGPNAEVRPRLRPPTHAQPNGVAGRCAASVMVCETTARAETIHSGPSTSLITPVLGEITTEGPSYIRPDDLADPLFPDDGTGLGRKRLRGSPSEHQTLALSSNVGPFIFKRTTRRRVTQSFRARLPNHEQPSRRRAE